MVEGQSRSSTLAQINYSGASNAVPPHALGKWSMLHFAAHPPYAASRLDTGLLRRKVVSSVFELGQVLQRVLGCARQHHLASCRPQLLVGQHDELRAHAEKA